MEKNEFERTILSQYSNSPRLISLLEGFNNRVDPRKDIDKFYNEVFNLDTCGTYGLDVWGVIVAAPRTVFIDSTDFFGYEDTTFEPFNVAPFYSGVMTPNTYRMEDEAYRRMIYFKAMVNIMNTSLPSMNRILYEFFQRMGRPETTDVYAQRTGVMEMRVVFRFSLTPIEKAIFRTYGTLIRPGGVGINYYEIPLETFGFQGSELRPFNQGIFFSGELVGLQ